MLTQGSTIVLDSNQLSDRKLNHILQCADGMTGPVLIDLSKLSVMTSASFAWLVRLRRTMRHHGRDMLITGLAPQAESLHIILKLSRILPIER